MKVEADLVVKYVFTASRPGHNCSSCGYDPDDEIREFANTLEELRDKVAVKVAYRGWNTVNYPSLYRAEFVDYDGLSLETNRAIVDEKVDEATLEEFAVGIFSSEMYRNEVLRIDAIMKEQKIVTERERREAERQQELETLAKLKEKYEPNREV
jgi:hypothetical protein